MRLVEEGIAAVAARQHGAVTRPQLKELGLTDRAVSRRAAAGRLHRVHRGVYRVGPLVAPYLREMAAVLACGPGARASHRSAAWLLDMGPEPESTLPAEVQVPASRVVRRPSIRVYRGRYLDPGGGAGDAASPAMTAHGIPVTSPGRTLVDLAAVLPTRDLEEAVARAEQSGLVTPDGLAALVDRHCGLPGIGTLAAVLGLDGGPAFTRSELERRFVDQVRRFGLPAPRFNVRVAGYEVDCWFAAERLVVELDGRAFHRSWRSQKNDRRRDRDLAGQGIQVVRVTWEELEREPDRTMAGVIRALALRGARADAR
jgi:very-short-patch-repair endonuclease